MGLHASTPNTKLGWIHTHLSTPASKLGLDVSPSNSKLGFFSQNIMA